MSNKYKEINEELLLQMASYTKQQKKKLARVLDVYCMSGTLHFIYMIRLASSMWADFQESFIETQVLKSLF